MNLLLDTHIILWSVSVSHRLSQKVLAELKSESNVLWFSPISAWEAFILAEKKRIVLEPEPYECFRKMIRKLFLIEAPLTFEVAIQSRQINLPHQDPADRFLAATALVYDLTLVTADKHLIGCKEISVLANK